jgi:glucose-6-phosphate isomerase
MAAIDDSESWRALKRHHRDVGRLHMRDLFAADARRFERFSLRLGDFLLDYSKNRVTDETMRLLRDLAVAAGVPDWIERMFRGERINATEGRAVLHVALRNRSNEPMRVDGTDVMRQVNAVLARMRVFAEAVRGGAWRGFTGQPIRAVVNIGIGGSDLGPRMAMAALDAYRGGGPECRFVSNVDGADLALALRGLDAASTLFVVASKTFTTQETMANAESARAWLIEGLGERAAVARHFVAVSTSRELVERFGIAPENMFEFWDWVGGRFSLWSAIGLPIALGVGMDNFERLLDGAHEMDRHFRQAPPPENLPLTLALLSVWNTNFLGAHSHAVLPYDQGLRYLPAYLQQAEMESNGKAVGRDGRRLRHHSAPVLWGEPGTNGQHAFYQLIHQGTRLVPCDFIAPAESAHALGRHHDILIANFLAQAEALMRGRSRAEAAAELAAAGIKGAARRAQLPHRVFPGNRPSNAILFRRLDPHTLGRLVALYEHKIFVEGVIWGVYSFDQWGVELGKQLAGRILPELGAGAAPGAHDGSTAGLIAHYRRLLGRR